MTSNPAVPGPSAPPRIAAPWTGPHAASDPGTGPRPDIHASPTNVGPDADEREVLSRPVSRGVVVTSVAVLLVGTGLLYLWGLSASGWANSFYSAAAQAGGEDWKAWFYGSLDAANAITVDKPPASLWLMGLSVRLFGLSSWSILVPQALLGIASVATLYATLARVVRSGRLADDADTGAPHRSDTTTATAPVPQGRTTATSPRERTPLTVRGHVAALLGAAVFALTPVAVLMFRFNNPDALLAFCLVLATHLTLRGSETGRARWVVGAGAVIGLGFLTKTLQAFLVLPALVAAYLVAAPVGWGKRLLHLVQAFVAMVVSAGWYVAVVELVPASMRPYVGGSQTDSFLELTFGYNGLGRITGNETGSVTGGAGFPAAGGNGGMWGETGALRMFSGVSGGMVSWLIPAALILAVAGLVFLRRRPRTDLLRAAIIAFGGWLLVTMAVFSFMAGIYHDYYTVVLAPAIGALVALGAYVTWQHRATPAGRLVLAAALAATTLWAVVLLGQASGLYLLLRWPVLVLGGLATAALAALPAPARRLQAVVVAAALAVTLTGPAAYALDTAATPHTGSIVIAGPVQGVGRGGPGAFGGGAPTGSVPGGIGNGIDGRAGGPGAPPAFAAGPGMSPKGDGSTGAFPGQAPTDGAGVGRAGGLLNGADVSDELADLLSVDADSFTWMAAAIGSQNAASYQLATEEPVMAIGGFNGSDPSPTLAQFQEYVAEGQVHWFIAGGMAGQQNGGSDAASQIAAWVAENFTARTVDGATVYDLTEPVS